MTMTDEQRVFVRGVKGRGDEVLKMLENRGGENYYLDGADPEYLYFINHKGSISLTLLDSEFGKIIMDNYRELHLPEQKWKEGDVLFSEIDNEFAVFEDECKIDSDKFLSYLATCYGGYLTYQAISRRDFRLATKPEVAQFHERLHAISKDWDAEQKELVNWRWRPKHEEAYYFVDTNTSVYKTVYDENNINDSLNFEVGNCFRTREEAEAMAEKVKKLLKGE